MRSAFNAMLNGIKNICGNIYGAVKGGFDKAIKFVKNLASQAFQWGADFIGGIVNGIKCVGKNPKLSQAKSKNDKNNSGLLAQIEAGKIGIHTFTNASAFTVRDVDTKIISIEFATCVKLPLSATCMKMRRLLFVIIIILV